MRRRLLSLWLVARTEAAKLSDCGLGWRSLTRCAGPQPQSAASSPLPRVHPRASWPRHAWIDPRRPVSVSQGTLALLLVGGVAVGTQADQLPSVQWHELQQMSGGVWPYRPCLYASEGTVESNAERYTQPHPSFAQGSWAHSPTPPSYVPPLCQTRRLRQTPSR